MAEKNIQMKRKQGDNWDSLYPVTRAKNTIDSNGKNVQEHIDDNSRHISVNERANWNNHAADNTRHITEAERTYWNAKANLLGSKVNVEGQWAGLRANSTGSTNPELDLYHEGIRRGLINAESGSVQIRKYTEAGNIETRLHLNSNGQVTINGNEVLHRGNLNPSNYVLKNGPDSIVIDTSDIGSDRILEFKVHGVRKGYFGRMEWNNSNSIRMNNAVAGRSLEIRDNGDLIYHSYEVWTNGNNISNLNSNGYRRFADGSIEQFGMVDNIQSGATVTFPITFPNLCIQAYGTMASTGPLPVGTMELSKTGMKVYYTGSGPRAVRWYAIGR